jgi:hypothetical protein
VAGISDYTGYQISATPGYVYPTSMNTPSSTAGPWFNQLMSRLQSYAKQQKAAQDALKLPAWMSQLYPGLAGLNQNDLASLMMLSESFGLPAGWKTGSGTDNSLGYAQLAEQQRQFNQQFPESTRQWNAQFGLDQNAQAFGQDYQNRTLAEQIAEANRAASQWNQNFDWTKNQDLWSRDFQTQQAQEAARQWAQQYALGKQNQDWTQNMGERQQTASEANDAFSKAMQQWSQAQQQAQFGHQVEQDAEQNKINREGLAMTAFGRRFAPNYAAM